MKTFALTVIAIACMYAPSRAADPFAGVWKIADAKTLAGKPYVGFVDIKASGEVQQLRWDTSAGKYSGVGLADGNRLCVAWGGKACGVVYYKMSGDGALDGRWSTPGATAEGTEKATGGTAGDFVGEYSITGSNPGGKGSYKGKLDIRKTGEVYQLKWTIPGTPAYTGVGLKVGDSLCVGWSTANETYAVIAYTFDGSSAQGIWTVGGSKSVAHENLSK